MREIDPRFLDAITGGDAAGERRYEWCLWKNDWLNWSPAAHHAGKVACHVEAIQDGIRARRAARLSKIFD